MPYTRNVNLGIVGHVDCGKTSLAKALSTKASTAAFDKNPQSQERGITLDLGFSCFKVSCGEDDVQYTLVDCPGHASLIKTIIGGAKIIDYALCVIDITHGIQTQTAECIVLTEILEIPILAVINKVDLLEKSEREEKVRKIKNRLHSLLTNSYHRDCPVVAVSAFNEIDSSYSVDQLKSFIYRHCTPPERPLCKEDFIFYVDHSFAIKGHGTVMTGTVIQGSLNLKSPVEIVKTKEVKKVKSMKVFGESVQSISQGDRAGVCFTQFDSATVERGIITKPGVMRYIDTLLCSIKRYGYYKRDISSHTVFHISVGYKTIMGRITLFGDSGLTEASPWEPQQSLKFLDKTEAFALVTFQKQIPYYQTDKIIGMKLDQDISLKSCRIAFHGKILNAVLPIDNLRDPNSHFISKKYVEENLKIFKMKKKHGVVDRIVDPRCVIVKDLFKKESVVSRYMGLQVELSSGQCGTIDSTFGTSGKVKVRLKDQINQYDKGNKMNLSVTLATRQSIFDKRKFF